jgi:hypothetical protein
MCHQVLCTGRLIKEVRSLPPPVGGAIANVDGKTFRGRLLPGPPLRFGPLNSIVIFTGILEKGLGWIPTLAQR